MSKASKIEAEAKLEECNDGDCDSISERFRTIVEYVEQGLPVSSVYYMKYHFKNKNKSTHGNRIKRKALKEKVWYDSENGSYERVHYPKEVLNALRFVDGLLADEGEDWAMSFCAEYPCLLWALMFKRKSKIVHDYEANVHHESAFHHKTCLYYDAVDQCSRSCNSSDSSDSEMSFTACYCSYTYKETIQYAILLMQYHVDNLVGHQNKNLMKNKILSILQDDVSSLRLTDKTIRTGKTSAKLLFRYLKSTAVVLNVLYFYEYWFKMHGFTMDNFSRYLEATELVETLLVFLTNLGMFDNIKLFQFFVNAVNLILAIDKFQSHDICIDCDTHACSKKSKDNADSATVQGPGIGDVRRVRFFSIESIEFLKETKTRYVMKYNDEGLKEYPATDEFRMPNTPQRIVNEHILSLVKAGNIIEFCFLDDEAKTVRQVKDAYSLYASAYRLTLSELEIRKNEQNKVNGNSNDEDKMVDVMTIQCDDRICYLTESSQGAHKLINTRYVSSPSYQSSFEAEKTMCTNRAIDLATTRSASTGDRNLLGTKDDEIDTEVLSAISTPTSKIRSTVKDTFNRCGLLS